MAHQAKLVKCIYSQKGLSSKPKCSRFFQSQSQTRIISGLNFGVIRDYCQGSSTEAGTIQIPLRGKTKFPKLERYSDSDRLNLKNNEKNAANTRLQLQLEETQNEEAKMSRGQFILKQTLSFLTSAYDTVTLPVYFAIQRPWEKMKLSNMMKAKCIDNKLMIYQNRITPISNLHAEISENGIDTVEKLFSYATKKHGIRDCVGTRRILSEENGLDSTGKSVKIFELGEYVWKSYSEVAQLADILNKSFIELGLDPGEKIAILAETRWEWLLTAMASFKRNLLIVTLFTTLHNDGIILAIKETEVDCLITSDELMPRAFQILEACPRVRQVIYMDRPDTKLKVDLSNLPKDRNIEVYKFSELLNPSFKSKVPHNGLPTKKDEKPKKDDPAIIMYTSGSSGVPKGVILTHYNFISALAYEADVIEEYDQAKHGDTHIAYLPLAHVLELMTETMCLLQGVHIGYSNPMTMTDKSPGIKPGTLGDATILKPTVLISVPLVLEKICKSIQMKVSEKGRNAEIIFNFFISYKNYWVEKGYTTPLVDRVFFADIKKLIGGRVRFIASGGAALSPKTQEFIRAVLSCPVLVGYGLTETTAAATLCKVSDLGKGRCGMPLGCSYIRLVNWAEGGYNVTDKPFPRGEIFVGGSNVALGYFKRPENKDFFTDDSGIRWIKTGDIAQVYPDGCFKIIDRKKDLVKLPNGEYISLGKIESDLKSIPLVENVCVCSDSHRSYTVALIVPSQPYLENLAKKLGIEYANFAELCKSLEICEEVHETLVTKGQALGLKSYEIPKVVKLIPHPWSPESDLVTASLKLKRENINKVYQIDIKRMFNSFEDSLNLKL